MVLSMYIKHVGWGTSATGYNPDRKYKARCSIFVVSQVLCPIIDNELRCLQGTSLTRTRVNTGANSKGSQIFLGTFTKGDNSSGAASFMLACVHTPRRNRGDVCCDGSSSKTDCGFINVLQAVYILPVRIDCRWARALKSDSTWEPNTSESVLSRCSRSASPETTKERRPMLSSMIGHPHIDWDRSLEDLSTMQQVWFIAESIHLGIIGHIRSIQSTDLISHPETARNRNTRPYPGWTEGRYPGWLDRWPEKTPQQMKYISR